MRQRRARSFDAAKIAEEDLPAASNQLAGIVEATEDATNQILTSTEKMLEDQERIKKVISSLESLEIPKDSKEREGVEGSVAELNALYDTNSASLMDIMAACNFQDLTGQRIEKIVTLVQGIESKIMKMILSFNIKRQAIIGAADDEMISRDKEILARIEEGELSGPKRKADAVGQSEVDDLLNDLFG